MRRLKKIVTAMLAAAVLVSGAAVPMEAQAASTLEKVLYGTAAMVFISRYFQIWMIISSCSFGNVSKGNWCL